MLWEQAVYVQYPSFPNYPGDFLFFSTRFFLYSLRLWRDGNICQIPTGCTSGTRPSQYATISKLWYLWSGKQPVSKSRVKVVREFRNPTSAPLVNDTSTALYGLASCEKSVHHGCQGASGSFSSSPATVKCKLSLSSTSSDFVCQRSKSTGRRGVWILWILWQPSHLQKFLLTAIKTDVQLRIRIFFARCIYRHDQTCILQALLGIDGNWFTAHLWLFLPSKKIRIAEIDGVSAHESLHLRAPTLSSATFSFTQIHGMIWHVGPHVTVWRFKAWWWMAVDDGCKFLVVASLLLACACYELRCPVGEYMPTSGASRCERCDAPMVTTQAYESKSDTVAPFCSKQVCFEQWRRQYHDCTCMHLEAPVARRLAGL